MWATTDAEKLRERHWSSVNKSEVRVRTMERRSVPKLLLRVLLTFFYWSGTTVSSQEFRTYNTHQGGILYPRESETREVRVLDGFWHFRTSDDGPLTGFTEKWYAQDLAKSGPVISMPVPSSYNDITVEKKIRDFSGVVWYERKFFVPDTWRTQGYHVWLRFGSVHYAASVWINGHLVMQHEIGHLPFLQEVTSFIRFGLQNRITVAVDNTLTQTTIPQGNLTQLDINDTVSEKLQTYTFDFFNYAGIHRSVHLYTTPTVYVDDISVQTDIESDATTGLVHYNVSVGGPLLPSDTVSCEVDLFDQDGNRVNLTIYVRLQNQTVPGTCTGTIEVPNATFWWPYLMHPKPGYMYTLQVRIRSEKQTEDVYRLPVGIRTLKWDNASFTINDKPVYIRGFGRHEDSSIRGKGLDLPLIARDYDLMKWIGANAYRTSHYPYAEEIMDKADELGIMIIDECPAVDLLNYSSILLEKHTDSMRELIRRDKNRPSVIMWSIANEPRSQLETADSHFRLVTENVRTYDKSRPLTAAIAQNFTHDLASQYLDIIGFNRYNSWYSDTGRLEIIYDRVVKEARNWYAKHNKPILMTEYGADTINGFHIEPSYVWSEEYQVDFLSEHFRAFDNLRKEGFFVGEMIWNFADFKTAETFTRVGGNRKGIFTRDRQPKDAAHHVRHRYWLLAMQLDNASLPDDLTKYTANVQTPSAKAPAKTEL